MDLRLFIDKKKSALVIATLTIIVISIVIVVAMITISRTNSINSSSFPDMSPLSKGNLISSTPPFLMGQSNAQKQEEEQQELEQKHIVPLDQIVNGGPPPDGIPSIDNPKFVTVQEAGNFLSDSDLVLGININCDIRVYPLLILVWHEIVNDNVGGVPVAITYCPLCFTSQVFNRTLDNNGKGILMLQFGTSGKLYNSNLVMYDRTSKSLWSQALGEGIVGKYAGQKLQRIPFDIAYWKDWTQAYPNSKILSKDTGFSRPYGADPYGDDYYTSDQLYFPVSNRDPRMSLKEKVIGFEYGEEQDTIAYRLQQIESSKVINDKINGKSIALFSMHPAMVRAFSRLVDGNVLDFQYNANSNNNKIIDKQTGSEWNFEGMAITGAMKGKQLLRLPFDEGFWFEWAAFHPKTAIYSG